MALPESPTSEYVERFAALMERQLAANRHKGNRPGWLGESFDFLKSRLCDEVAELFDQITCDGSSGDIAKEAADVANFCMFLADKAGGL
jgi:NTP pyrophosphatase (non-canonical NTP hydrolase)